MVPPRGATVPMGADGARALLTRRRVTPVTRSRVSRRSTHPRPQERAELFAAAYVVNYLAFGVPTLLAGLAARKVGLLPTATAYGAVVTGLALLTVVLGLRAGRTARPAPRCPATT